MNKSIYLLPILLLFTIFSCSDDNDENMDKQDYTSFVVSSESTNVLTNCVAAYKQGDKYIKIANLGEITKGVDSKEVKIDDSINEIYIFGFVVSTVRLDSEYKIEKGKKNIIILKKDTKGIGVEDTTNPFEYPQ